MIRHQLNRNTKQTQQQYIYYVICSWLCTDLYVWFFATLTLWCATKSVRVHTNRANADAAGRNGCSEHAQARRYRQNKKKTRCRARTQPAFLMCFACMSSYYVRRCLPLTWCAAHIYLLVHIWYRRRCVWASTAGMRTNTHNGSTMKVIACYYT